MFVKYLSRRMLQSNRLREVEKEHSVACRRASAKVNLSNELWETRKKEKNKSDE